MKKPLLVLGLSLFAAACATSAVVFNPDGGASDAGADSTAGDAASCPEFDLKTDPKHCGSCTKACAAGEVCSLGVCKAQCTAPTTTCTTDAGPICADLSSDPKRCGSCTTACSTADAGNLAPGTGNPEAGIPFDGGYDAGPGWSLGTPSCAKSACQITCPGSMTACSDICFDTQNHHEHCGGCATACAADTEWCNGGKCCAVGKLNCNGTCTDVLGDPNNCGGCGVKCASNLTCGGGACVACSSLAGPASFPNTLSGWPSAGIRIKALKNTTLTGFTFNNVGAADTVILRSISGTTLQTISTPASNNAYVATVSWQLTAGTSYDLVATSSANGKWISYSSYPTLGSSIQVDGMVNTTGTLSTQYWFTFTNLQTCP